MCQCGTTPNTPPDAGPSPSAPAGNAIQVCPGFDSSILVIDELGLPMQNSAVSITFGTDPPQSHTTDSDGRVCFHRPPGTAVVVRIVDTHESQPGQSTTTPSGRHFGHLMPGP